MIRNIHEIERNLKNQEVIQKKFISFQDDKSDSIDVRIMDLATYDVGDNKKHKYIHSLK
jgi:hypothetical protein